MPRAEGARSVRAGSRRLDILPVGYQLRGALRPQQSAPRVRQARARVIPPLVERQPPCVQRRPAEAAAPHGPPHAWHQALLPPRECGGRAPAARQLQYDDSGRLVSTVVVLGHES